MTTSTLDAPSSPQRGGMSVSSIYDAVFRFFCSLRLTVVTIFLLMVGSFTGMFVDQTKSYEDHAKVWAQSPGQWKYYLFTWLEFYDVFHSWWFGVAVLVIALNLIACSIDRLPKIWIDIQNPDPALTPKKERGIKHKSTFQVEDAAAFEDAFIKAVGRGDKPIRQDEGDIRYGFKEKDKYGRTGVYVVHIALLFIMFGSMATTTLGFDGTVGIVEGTKNRYAFGRGPAGLRFRQDLGYEVKCTDFRLKQFVDGAPMDFESDLIIIKDGKEVAWKTIQVNDPLEYEGFTLYQSSYQPVPGDERVQLAIGRRGTPKTLFNVTPGTRIDVPGTTTSFTPLEIIPQYASMGEALRVQQVTEGQPPTSFVVFKNYPDFDENVRRGEFALHFKGSDKTYMTGIQVGRVPGIEVVFWGFALMFVGMYMAFFMSHRRYWVRLQKAKDGSWTATVAGAARRHQYAFEEEWDAMVASLKALPGVRTSRV